jgi:hypothetical protein
MIKVIDRHPFGWRNPEGNGNQKGQNETVATVTTHFYDDILQAG